MSVFTIWMPVLLRNAEFDSFELTNRNNFVGLIQLIRT